jgi:hypothetical protein
MKKLFALTVIIALTISVLAQAPQKMSYQAVIRNSSGQLLANHAVGMRLSILQGSSTGTPVYVETQTPTTNGNGLATVEIGGGTLVSGTFAGINWGAGPYYLKTETDPAGATDYAIVGTSQLLSVPYALHSKKAESAKSVDSPVYAIGLNNDLGGYVIYVTPDGKHGLVVATQDQSTSSTWYNAFNVVNDPYNHDTAGKNFTDWRLPTLSEFALIHNNRIGIGGFTSNLIKHWSSTEYDYSKAIWGAIFDYSVMNDVKTSLYCVRAVRSF